MVQRGKCCEQTEIALRQKKGGKQEMPSLHASLKAIDIRGSILKGILC